MGEGRLLGDEVLLRRFNPANSDHTSVHDQKTGERRLTSGALRWDREPEDESRPLLRHGISVFRLGVLRQHHLPKAQVLDPPHVGLAEAIAERIRLAGTAYLPNPIDVVEDPLPVTGPGDAHNVAHSLITCQPNLSKNQMKRVKTGIAFAFTVVVL